MGSYLYGITTKSVNALNTKLEDFGKISVAKYITKPYGNGELPRGGKGAVTRYENADFRGPYVVLGLADGEPVYKVRCNVFIDDNAQAVGTLRKVGSDWVVEDYREETVVKRTWDSRHLELVKVQTVHYTFFECRNGNWGTHSIACSEYDDRVEAHWNGYCSNNAA